MTFFISALVLARDSHIKPDSEAGVLIWVEGWYQLPYGKFHVIIFLSHIIHWPFPSIDFYIAKKIYEQTNCKNKSLRELPLFNLQIFLYPRSPKRGGIVLYLCPSKVFFVAFFSVTIDGRNLIFGHKHHIGIPYCG